MREKINSLLTTLSDNELGGLKSDWPLFARADQLAPQGDWTSWLILGGRGAGKTRSGAEWVRHQARDVPGCRIALVGETFSDARDVMVEGVSGLLNIHRGDERPVFEKTRLRLVWPNGSEAQLFSAEEPDGLRGPQFHFAWADEMAKWRHMQATFDNLQFGLRLGARPRQVLTTTPRPVPLLKKLLDDKACAVTRCATADNADNLPRAFVDYVNDRYGRTRLGRQELLGEMVATREDALWSRAMIDDARVHEAPELRRIVVAIDPAATSGKNADACGIVAVGQAVNGEAYVLDDASAQGLRPDQWAARAIALYHRLGADVLIAEVNNGGDMVEAVIRAVDAGVPVNSVHASRGKFARAEPVAALYARGRVHHVGMFAALEDEMCDFGVDGLSGGRSPDRLDALVWAIAALKLDAGEPGIRRL